MKLICKISCMLTVCSLFILTLTAISISASAAEKTWQQAYLEAMESYQHPAESGYCCLVYLDDDDVPEFYIGDPLEYWFGGLYSFSDGESIALRNFGFRDFFSAYSEKSGIFKNYYYIERAGSKTGIKFVKMENFSLTVLDEFSYDVVNDIYEVNGEETDKESYDNKISEYSSVDTEPDLLTYDEMKQYLLDSMESENYTETDEIPDETTAYADTEEINSDETPDTVNISKSTNTRYSASPKTGDSEPLLCELIVIASITAAAVIVLGKSRYEK